MREQQDANHSQTSPKVVRVESGSLAGVSGANPKVTVYKGVPYAAAPTGELRWRAPEPPTAWEGVRRADTFGSICPQFIPAAGSFYQLEFYLKDEPQSEDCLFLNIWTAAQGSEERRPVMVWFHGGGMIEGSGSLPSFHGETLVEKGVVLVTINYRLGVFGYYAHPALSAESEQRVAGNYGLLDQIQALKWVRNNIAAFGGDPDNVTIFGQSAGSMGVFNMLVSPLAGGLFHRAIGQSGSPFSFRSLSPTLREAEQAGLKLAERWGAASLSELRALSTEALLGTDVATYRSVGFRPNVDGWAVPEEPAGIMAQGRQHAVPLLVGSTADEFTTMIWGTPMPADTYRQQMAELYGDQAEEFLRLYPVGSDATTVEARVRSMADQFVAGTRAWAQHHYGVSDTYLYFFDRKLPGRNSEAYGAFHSGELYYVFGTLASTDRPWNHLDLELADAMTSYWTNFAATGDPNGEGLVRWPAYDEQGDQMMELGDRIRVIPFPNKEGVAFFQRQIEERLVRRVSP